MPFRPIGTNRSRRNSNRISPFPLSPRIIGKERVGGPSNRGQEQEYTHDNPDNPGKPSSAIHPFLPPLLFGYGKNESALRFLTPSAKNGGGATEYIFVGNNVTNRKLVTQVDKICQGLNWAGRPQFMLLRLGVDGRSGRANYDRIYMIRVLKVSCFAIGGFYFLPVNGPVRAFG